MIAHAYPQHRTIGIKATVTIFQILRRKHEDADIGVCDPPPKKNREKQKVNAAHLQDKRFFPHSYVYFPVPPTHSPLPSLFCVRYILVNVIRFGHSQM